MNRRLCVLGPQNDARRLRDFSGYLGLGEFVRIHMSSVYVYVPRTS